MPKLTPEEKKHIQDLQEESKRLLANPQNFEKKFEEIFRKYDTNKDQKIDLAEYESFIHDMLSPVGRKINFNLAVTYFGRADKDNNGSIEKDEFKKEFERRLREFSFIVV